MSKNIFNYNLTSECVFPTYICLYVCKDLPYVTVCLYVVLVNIK